MAVLAACVTGIYFAARGHSSSADNGYLAILSVLNGSGYTFKLTDFESGSASCLDNDQNPANCSTSLSSNATQELGLDAADSWADLEYDVFDSNGNYLGHFGVRLTPKAVTVSDESGISVHLSSYEPNQPMIISIDSPCLNPVPTSAYYDMTLNVVWDPHTQSLQPKPFADDAMLAGQPGIITSFVTAAGNNCSAAFGGFSEYAPPFGLPAIQAYQQQAGKVAISFGGAAGTYLQDVCSQDDLKTQIQNIIDTYAVKNLDFDIEGAALGNEAAITKLAAVLAQLQQKYSGLQISLTLPVATTGLTAEGLSAVTQFKNAGLNFRINIMAMDFGNCEDMAACAISAANATITQLQINYTDLAITPMIGINDDASGDSNNEVFTLENAETLSAFCRRQGGELRYWDFNRDYPGADIHSNDNSGAINGVPVQASNFSFARTLMNCSTALFALPISSSKSTTIHSEDSLNLLGLLLAAAVLIPSLLLCYKRFSGRHEPAEADSAVVNSPC